MWVWLIISMVIVTGCIIFGIYCLISSRTVQKIISDDLKSLSGISKYDKIIFPISHQQQNPLILKSIEKNSDDQGYQLNNLKKRIETLEEESSTKINKEEAKWNEGENWEKLYYDTTKEKKVLEEELDLITNILQESQDKIQEVKKDESVLMEVRNEIENKKNEINYLQNIIEEQKYKLESAADREKELEQQIDSQKYLLAECEMLRQQNKTLRSEFEELEIRLMDIKAQNILRQKKIKRLTELESLLEISEYEKMEIKNSVAQIITEL